MNKLFLLISSLIILQCNNTSNVENNSIQKSDILGTWILNETYVINDSTEQIDTTKYNTLLYETDYYNAYTLLDISEDNAISYIPMNYGMDNFADSISYELVDDTIIMDGYIEVFAGVIAYGSAVKIANEKLYLINKYTGTLVFEKCDIALPSTIWETGVLQDNYENDDSIQVANNLDIDLEVTGHSIHIHDIDWYKFYLDSSKNYQATVTSATWIPFTLHDSIGLFPNCDWKNIEHESSNYMLGPTTMFISKLEYSGIYYIKLMGHNELQGQYTLKVEETD